MGNMDIWGQVEKTPDYAKKAIQAGRLKGFTDINPMYRIQKLTEVFGAVGFGWYTEILREPRIDKADNGEATATIEINLYVKQGDEWSKPIYGIGGSKFITNEKSGAYVSDECYKMAYTDAISVACKALGMSADVYFGDKGDRSKYTATQQDNADNNGLVTDTEAKSVYSLMVRKGLNVVEQLKNNYGIDNTSKLNKQQWLAIVNYCNKLPDKEG